MTTRAMVVSLAAVLAAAAASAPDTAPPARRLSRSVLEDKIRGGWAGQMIGVSFGAPTEFRFKGRIIEGPIAWKPENVSNAIDQDDLYVEMTFAEVMDGLGLQATTEQYGEMFKDSKYDLWHANAGARRLLNHGIKAPWSGHPRYNVHANDIDFQIESDFIGLMTPGLPQEANKYADRVGRVMNYGDGLYGGMFFGGMYAAAFFESDPRRVVEAGLRSIPAESGYAKVIRDVLAWSARHPEDWKKTWRLLTDKWDKDDPCPDGALDSFNIDARLNGAFVALGLLYGNGDFTRTLDVSTRAGQDSDCNPSSAAGILGVMLGYGRIPPALEQWSVDPPTARIALGDPAWTWSEGWSDAKDEERSSAPTMKAADKSGAVATLRFRGTGLSVVGRCSQEGGRADVYLDGEKAGEIDAYVVPRTHDNDYWHVTALKSGEHTLRIVTRADKDERSTGTQIGIERAIVYGN